MKTLLALFSQLQFKKDWKLVAYACFITLVLFGFAAHHDLTWSQAGVLLGAALGSPALFGRKSNGDDSSTDIDDDQKPSSGSRLKAVVDASSTIPPKNERRVLRLLVAPIAAAFFVVLMACSSVKPADVQTAKEVTHTTLTLLEEACVVANAAFGKTEVAKYCNIIGPKLDIVDRLISSQKAAGAMPTRRYPVVCEETDAGVVCTKPYVEPDAGAR